MSSSTAVATSVTISTVADIVRFASWVRPF
jgi:hypothetical protein